MNFIEIQQFGWNTGTVSALAILIFTIFQVWALFRIITPVALFLYISIIVLWFYYRRTASKQASL